ncbi:hypothetical protein CHUAL_006059 [Chamberlinius hualienensis]
MTTNHHQHQQQQQQSQSNFGAIGSLQNRNISSSDNNDNDGSSSMNMDNSTWTQAMFNFSSLDLFNASTFSALPFESDDDIILDGNSSVVSGPVNFYRAFINATVESINDTWYLINVSNGTEFVIDGGIGSSIESDIDSVDGSSVGPFDVSLYPSGKSMTHIVVTAVLVTMLMIMIVVGNMLVIVAISTEKALKTIQNWFIASLAVADFFLGLVVMPFSLAQELMGYWIFGVWWCEIYLAIDVLLCTSSIMNLCLISLDRYWSITQAVDYLKKRTASRAILMLSIVWILSFLISVPPLLGWKKLGNPKDIPYCEVSNDLGYVIYSASGSFFIPSVIMVFVYVRIYYAARSRARRVVKKHRPQLDPCTKDKSTTTTSFSNASPPDRNKNTPNTSKDIMISSCCDSNIKSPQLLAPPTSVALISSTPNSNSNSNASSNAAALCETCEKVTEVPCSGNSNGVETKKVTIYESDVCEETTEAANNRSDICDPLLRPEKPTTISISMSGAGITGITGTAATPTTPNYPGITKIPVVIVEKPHLGGGGGGNRTGYMFGLGSTNNKANGNSSSSSSRSSGRLKTNPSPNRLVSQAHALAQAQAQILLSDEVECLSELDHSSDSDQPIAEGQVSGLMRLRYLCNPPKKKKEKKDEIDMIRVTKPRDPEREKRRIARKKERRATLILGLIMAAFILSWLPFFTLYLVRGLCVTCQIDDLGFTFAFWLGYCNSALNPVIYTIFNKDFRKAFRKILFK